MTVGIDDHRYAFGHSGSADTRDICGTLSSCPTDTNSVEFLMNARIADGDIVITLLMIEASCKTQCDVIAALIVVERTNTDGRVVVPDDVVEERTSTDGRVVLPRCCCLRAQ